MDRITALLGDARDGSEEALDRLFATCGDRLLSYIRLRLGAGLRSRLESRDILQATLLKAFAALDGARADSTASMMAWLARIADNEIRDQADFHHRQQRDAGRELPLDKVRDHALGERLRTLSSRIDIGQRMTVVARAFDRLDPDHREVILLRYFHELGFAEIGERMGRSADASRMLLARAMSALTLSVGGSP